jgi:hypothetical protein
MFEEPTPEEEDEIIRSVAEHIYRNGMDLVAILFLESFKPLASVYGPMARFMVGPFLPVYSDEAMKYMAVFQNKENLEKLISLLEEKSREDTEKQREKGKRRRLLPW